MGSLLPPCSTTNLSHHQPSVLYSQATLANSAVNPTQIPLLHDPVSSDDDSDYDMSTQQPTNPDITSVKQRDQTKPPVLTSSKVSTQVLQDFSEGCESYFFHKEIAPNKQVSAIIMGIKDHQVKKTFQWLAKFPQGSKLTTPWIYLPHPWATTP